jgi:hypothetical protein
MRLERRRLLGFAVLAAIPVVAQGALPSAGAAATVARFHDALLAGMKAGREASSSRRSNQDAIESLAPSNEQLRAALWFRSRMTIGPDHVKPRTG